ncbi:PREDICTED: proactivator polypeptide-like, partial [Chlamydotis macqueenii]|uniref:proactivator polypeptide-like n=1 Tax=Chlamydotis macqueenii TaxID=187382 RepID=UPI0005297B78
DPMELCGHLGLCSSASALPLHTLLTEKVTQVLSMLVDEEGTTPLCEVCQFAVKVAESLLENNVTEEQLVNDIEKVCYMLPHGVIGQCKDFVDSYGKAVVIMLLEATDPTAICTMLHCCPRSGDAYRGAAALEKLVVDAGTFCNCEALVVQYEPAAVRLRGRRMDTHFTFVCTKIRVCDSSREDPCAWGPQYWCKNMATA